jgi:hypothetical protein
MFFVVSTGRSGTQTIARMLSSLSGCVSVHEPAPQLIVESSGYRYGLTQSGELRDLLLATRSRHKDGAVYCESNQTLSLIIPVLAETFPEARYIWLLRNGLDVVASAYSKQWYSGHSENHDRYEDCPPLERAWIHGRIQGDRSGDISIQEWNDLDRFGKCCWYWGYVNRVIEEDLKNYAGHRHILLRLEELDLKFHDLVKWMGLKAVMLPRAKPYNTGKRIAYHWSHWSTSERQVFSRWCGNLMDRLYPSWRTGDNWHGVKYSSYSGFVPKLRTNHQLVKQINVIFSRR